MAFTGNLTNIVPDTRRASTTSFEAWMPPFTGLHKPNGVDVLMAFDQFIFKPSKRGNRLKAILNVVNRIEILANGVKVIMVACRKRSLLHPFNPPILLMDAEDSKILRIDSESKTLCLNEIQVLSSAGILGLTKASYCNGTKTYEVFDAYKQLAFYITPNLAPHRAVEFLILGPERAVLTAAFFKREEDYALEIFKPLSPILKALLISFGLCVINSYSAV